jgi:putative SOS response-associated peptidase YedK
VPADGWYEWKKSGSRKQPYFTYRRDSSPLFMAALGHAPFDADHGGEGFVILTAASDEGLLDVHDRRPVVLGADAALEWLHAGTSVGNAEHVIAGAALPDTAFSWHPVAAGVGNPHNQGSALISPVNDPVV